MFFFQLHTRIVVAQFIFSRFSSSFLGYKNNNNNCCYLVSQTRWNCIAKVFGNSNKVVFHCERKLGINSIKKLIFSGRKWFMSYNVQPFWKVTSDVHLTKKKKVKTFPFRNTHNRESLIGLCWNFEIAPPPLTDLKNPPEATAGAWAETVFRRSKLWRTRSAR